MPARHNVGGVSELLLKNDILTMTRILLCYRALSLGFGFAILQLQITLGFRCGKCEPVVSEGEDYI